MIPKASTVIINKCYRSIKHYAKHFTYNCFNLHNKSVRYEYYSHITDEEAEAQND